MSKCGRDLKIGDIAYGRAVLALRTYQVPAACLNAYYAARHPEGMPAWIATLGPGGSSGRYEITIFHDDVVPMEGA